jgi:hypothetical protein
MRPRTPRRLLDGSGPSRLVSALARAEADLGSATDLARMRAKLAPHIAQVSIGGSSVGQAAAASAAGKAALIVAGTLVLGGVAWLTHVATAPDAAPVQPRPMQVEVAVLPAAANGKPLTATAATSVPVPPSATDTAREPHSAAALPRAASASRKPRPPERPTAPSTTATARVDDELQLLRRAQDAIDTRPRAALDALDAHARAYPHGVFAQERESLAIDALRKLGRRQEAIARAHAFMARHPTSPHARRLLSWLQSTTEDSKTAADRIPAP